MTATDTENIINIINAVKAHECLWNVHSAEYAKRDRLERAWSQVAQDVGRSDTYCREKWRNVRTGFLRSIQNNIRIVTDESSNDLMAVRKKRFYLYDYMKFLLPSAETLEIARKRRKLSRVRGKIEDLNEHTNESMQEYILFGKYEQNSEMDNAVDYGSIEQELMEESTQEVDTNCTQLAKGWQKSVSDKNAHLAAATIAEKENKSVQQSETKSSSPADILVTVQQRDKTFRTRYTRGYDDRDVEQLVDFFRGNVDDVLSLSKKNQRTFKRKMIELIEELHDIEDSLE